MTFTLAQRRALAILPKVTGILSMMGSSVILVDVLRSKTKKKNTYSRIMLGLSSFDLIISFMFFLSTWPIPAGSGPIYASGTTGSCTFQGFFIQLGLAIPLYNICLATYYVMVIRLKWNEKRIKSIERVMHGTVLSVAFAVAIAGLPLSLYNNANLWCWIASLPASCANSRNGKGECTRGDNAWAYRFAFFYGPIWFCIAAITLLMGVVATSVWQDERASRRFRRDGRLSSLTSNVAWQAFYYVLAFYLAWIFPTTLRLLETLNKPVPYPIILFMAILLPMQGMLNGAVYVRPRYLRYRKKHRNKGFFRCCVGATTGSFRAVGAVGSSVWSILFKSPGDTCSTASSANLDDEENDVATLDPSYALQSLRVKLEHQNTKRNLVAHANESVSAPRTVRNNGNDNDEEEQANNDDV